MKRNKHIGSNFDDFLAEEGILEECKGAAVKQVVAIPTPTMDAEKTSV